MEDRIFSGGKVKEVKGGNMDLYESLLKENGHRPQGQVPQAEAGDGSGKGGPIQGKDHCGTLKL